MLRYVFLLLFWGIFSELPGQQLNGKWTGYFTPNADMEGKYYAYELTISENAKHELTVQAITKFPNLKMAIAFAKGLYTPQTQLVSIQETKFEYLRIDPNMQVCLMNNFLTYQNVKGHEVLQGTYISNNAMNGKDCGGGSLFLEKVQPIVKFKPNPKIEKQVVVQAPTKKQPETNTQKTTTLLPLLNTTSIPSELKEIKEINDIKKREAIEPVDAVIESKPDTEQKNNNEVQVIPWVLVGRENKLVKKIITHNKSISIDLYDNGTIDNDTINVYDNKVLLVNKKRLSYKSIHIDLNFTNSVTEHEVIIVAHNMGTVPPNTALLVYKDGMSRQELFITSTNKTNAKLIIEYVPPSP